MQRAIVSATPAIAFLAVIAFPAVATADSGMHMEDDYLLVPPLVHAGYAWDGARPDAHAPIGVMGDSTHHAGGWMVSYRFMLMSQDGLRDGTASVTSTEVLEQYPITPTEMTMQMHMFDVMYAVADDLTLMMMLPYLRYGMSHATITGDFSATSDGIGDLQLGALVSLLRGGRHRIHLNLAGSMPTGSIDAKQEGTEHLHGGDGSLGYPMQLGSGTFDLLLGLTYRYQAHRWSLGAQGGATLRLGTNDHGYRLGNRLLATAWFAVPWADWISTSARVSGSAWGDVVGADRDLDPTITPAADPDLRGGRQVAVHLGVNLSAPGGALRGHHLGLEFSVPVYRDLDGPQVETDWFTTLGWQYSF